MKESTIIISRLQEPKLGYEFILNGILFTDDLEILITEIENKIADKSIIISDIIIDISNIEAAKFFKINRFIGMCKKIANKYNKIYFEVVIDSHYYNHFPQLKVSDVFNVETSKNKIKKNDDNVKRVNYNKPNKLLSIFGFSGEFQISKEINISSIYMYLFLMLISITILKYTVIGLIMFLGSGVLIFETYLYYRICKKNKINCQNKSESYLQPLVYEYEID